MPPQRGEKPAATWESRCPPPEAPEGSPAAGVSGRPCATDPAEPESLKNAVRLDAPQTQSDPESLRKAERLDAPQRRGIAPADAERP